MRNDKLESFLIFKGAVQKIVILLFMEIFTLIERNEGSCGLCGKCLGLFTLNVVLILMVNILMK
jgi:hypothetical protein